jgi:subtilase family serine protease
MKNSIIILIGVFVFITGNVMAATPVDGHYEGETSQELVSGETGNEVSFDVINGVPQNFYFNTLVSQRLTEYSL